MRSLSFEMTFALIIRPSVTLSIRKPSIRFAINCLIRSPYFALVLGVLRCFFRASCHLTACTVPMILSPTSARDLGLKSPAAFDTITPLPSATGVGTAMT